MLLQYRLDRVPYKQIGAKLGKSDLACRLHFHQMVTAKRTPETPAGRSIVYLSSEHPPEVHRLAPSRSTTNSKVPTFQLSSPIKSPRKSKTQFTMNQLRPPHEHHRSLSWSNSGMLSRAEGSDLLPSLDPRHQRRSSTSVDIHKLSDIYQEHASTFWSNIAAKYSGNDELSAYDLEFAFLNAYSSIDRDQESDVVSQLTPDNYFTSARSTGGQATLRPPSRSPSIMGRCSVESLLNF